MPYDASCASLLYYPSPGMVTCVAPRPTPQSGYHSLSHVLRVPLGVFLWSLVLEQNLDQQNVGCAQLGSPPQDGSHLRDKYPEDTPGCKRYPYHPGTRRRRGIRRKKSVKRKRTIERSSHLIPPFPIITLFTLYLRT
jgi:hypothetical protein